MHYEKEIQSWVLSWKMCRKIQCSPTQAQHRWGASGPICLVNLSFLSPRVLKILECQLHDCASLWVRLVVAINEVNRKQSSVIFREEKSPAWCGVETLIPFGFWPEGVGLQPGRWPAVLSDGRAVFVTMVSKWSRDLIIFSKLKVPKLSPLCSCAN